MSKGIKLAVISLLVILLFSVALLMAGGEEDRTWPSIGNSKPSGLRAFSILLQEDGFQPVLSRQEVFDTKEGDLIIAAFINQASDESFFTPRASDLVKLSYDKHLENGGRIIALPFPVNFDNATERAYPQSLETEWLDEPLDVDYVGNFETFEPDWAEADFNVDYSTSQSEQFLSYGGAKNGVIVMVATGLGASNRRLGEGDNAEFFLELVRQNAEPGARIIFSEVAFANTQGTSAFGLFGSWTKTVQNQILLLLVVIMVTLGSRFGLPIWSLQRERGAREMVDALAHTLRRSGKPEFALRVLVQGAWRRIRVTQRAPRSKSPSQMLPSLPSGLKVVLAEADAAIQSSVSRAEAVSLGRRLEDQLIAYEKDSRKAADEESNRPGDAA